MVRFPISSFCHIICSGTISLFHCMVTWYDNIRPFLRLIPSHRLTPVPQDETHQLNQIRRFYHYSTDAIPFLPTTTTTPSTTTRLKHNPAKSLELAEFTANTVVNKQTRSGENIVIQSLIQMFHHYYRVHTTFTLVASNLTEPLQRST